MVSEEEIWKDVPGYEGFYQVSNLGRVKSLERTKRASFGSTQTVKEKFLMLNSNSLYPAFMAAKYGGVKCIRVHRLVALIFVPNPNNYIEVNHIDGNKRNNHYKNLEWCTRQENCLHMYKIGLAKPVKSWLGKINTPDRSIPVLQYDMTGVFIKEWPSVAETRRQHGYHVNNIWNCIYGKFKQAYGFIWKLKHQTQPKTNLTPSLSDTIQL